jgi:hypothetical protein
MTRSAVEKKKRPLNSKVISTNHLFTFVLKYSNLIKAQTIEQPELVLELLRSKKKKEFYFREEKLLLE